MIEFILGLIIAILTGTAQFAGASSMTSENVTPDYSFRVEWPCGQSDIETCWLEYDKGIVRTGP